MALSLTNYKAAEYVSCWLCDHFQRYDPSTDVVTFCAGDCRLKPRQEVFDGETVIDPNPPEGYLVNSSWPVIPIATYYQCGRFQKTREKNLPGLPTECPIPADFTELAGWIYNFKSAPWSKKINAGYVDDPADGVMCWNCDHFDPDSEEEGVQGYCQANPPLAYQDIAIGTMIGAAYSTNRSIDNGACFWCAQWERAQSAFRELTPAELSCSNR